MGLCPDRLGPCRQLPSNPAFHPSKQGCWPTSRRLAEALHRWIPNVIQSVEPYMSSEDIRQGSRWLADISEHLEGARFGILCLTPENLEAPWLLFEAGALSKFVKASLVVPYLFNLSAADLQGPLAQFQAAGADEESTRKMLFDLNSAFGEQKLEESRLHSSFERWWPELASEIGGIESDSTELASPRQERDIREIMEEVLELVRNVSRQSTEELSEIKFMLRTVRNTVVHSPTPEHEGRSVRLARSRDAREPAAPRTIVEYIAELMANFPDSEARPDSTAHSVDGEEDASE